MKELGPLAPLVGIWEGDKGNDIAPDDNRGTETNKYRERMTFEYIGEVNNHEQVLFGLRYATKAWRLGEDKGFHEEVGYWLWDPASKQVMKTFLIPRGLSCLAGGTADPDAKTFEMSAEIGSTTYGICSNPFLDKEFRTVAFKMKIIVQSPTSFSYEQETQLQIKGQKNVFSHTDRNTLKKTS